MELSWVNKLRIALVAALGSIVIGILAWPMVAPADPMAPVRSANAGFSGTVVLLALAFALGAISYFLAWPHGREIGILTVPFGLTVWATRSGPMRMLTQAYPQPAAREALLHSLRFEPIYWLLIVAAGFAGVIVAQHLRPVSGTPTTASRAKGYLKTEMIITVLVTLMVVILISQFFLGAFARDLPRSAAVAASQPAKGQILFAGVAAFAIAAFAAKKFFGLSYLWPAIASVFVIPFAEVAYCRGDTIQSFAETQPATSFPHAVLAILPIQLVALGAIGSVVGYWTAVRYDHWRTHETA
jgi:hypothetical protein